MAISFVASALANNGATATTATAAFTIPAGAAAGDFAIVTLMTNANSVTMSTTPSGWTLRTSAPYDNATSHRVWVYYKKLVGGEPGASATWTASGVGRYIGIMDVFHNVDATTQVEDTQITTNSGALSSYPAPAVTTASTNSWVYNVWSVKNSAVPSPTITVPGTHTAAAYSAYNGASGAGVALRGGYLTTPGAAGSYGSYSATATASTGIEVSFALKPAASHTPGTQKRWNGSAFKTGGTLKRWDGSTFKTGGTLRRWDGSGFQPPTS